MKVVQISDPASFHTEQWIRQLMDRDIETHVIFIKGWYLSEHDRIQNIEGCQEKIFDIPDKRNLGIYLLRRGKIGTLFKGILNHTSLFGELEYLKRHLHNYMTSNSIDVIHAHYFHSGGFLAHASGFQPTIISSWGSDILVGPKKYPYYIPLIRKALNSATIIQTASEMSAKIICQKYLVDERKIFVTSWGADTDLFKPDLDSARLREELGIPEGFIILSFRALDSFYRIDLIIQAFKTIYEKHKDVSLVIGNDGPQRMYLENLCRDLGISNRVFFTGKVFSTKMARLFALADIYIQCPKADGVSVSALQALASGLPIIANNVGETQAIVKHELTGLLLDDSPKPQPYAAALNFLLENENMRKNMAKESRRLSKSKHDRRKIFDKFENLYSALAQGASEIDSHISIS